MFVVHGQACLHSPAHPTCTHTKEGVKPTGKSYVVDLKPILGSDWRVRTPPSPSLPTHVPASCFPLGGMRSAGISCLMPACIFLGVASRALNKLQSQVAGWLCCMHYCMGCCTQRNATRVVTQSHVAGSTSHPLPLHAGLWPWRLRALVAAQAGDVPHGPQCDHGAAQAQQRLLQWQGVRARRDGLHHLPMRHSARPCHMRAFSHTGPQGACTVPTSDSREHVAIATGCACMLQEALEAVVGPSILTLTSRNAHAHCMRRWMWSASLGTNTSTMPASPSPT